MNIYDEAKVITHEEVDKAIDYIANFISDIPMSLNGYNNPNSNQWICDQIDIVNVFIDQQKAKEERAKKVEELLKLYQEKDFVIKKYTKNSFSYLSELERLSYEISIKEKELGEMK